ncbi:hypothetical protein ACWEF6_01690 [Amycolatopsis sp. NPDC004772]
MSKRADLKAAFEALKKDINSEPFNSGELERKANEQAKKPKDGK